MKPQEEMTPQQSTLVSKEETTPPRKKSKLPLILSIVLISLLTIGAAGYFILTSQASERNAEVAYEALEDSYNIIAYEDFLTEYPDSQYGRDVRTRLERLKMLQTAWQSISSSANKSDFVDFISRYGDPFYENLAKGKIDSLDWQDALKQNTKEAFSRYLELHPNGRYVSEASVAGERMENVEIDEYAQEEITSNIERFFDALGENNETQVCLYIAPQMEDFIGKKNATKADVIETMQNMFNEHILSCSFILNGNYDISKTQNGTNAPIYTINFNADQRITRDNEGKTFGSYQVTMKMNARYEITSLVMKEISRINSKNE